ncbi:hypothetical protein IC229_27575 [Spirosoma sp. BT702]|uniref:Uncharacterized protein n=1 Tax=Spirosoma profusum TaxID=2771354 RepID=A0A926Y3S6_9BACT|nr:hypothetical protein [Spirosoma profusum]MBD2704432.1 hypothetical protein [Spirosoma profusum]
MDSTQIKDQFITMVSHLITPIEIVESTPKDLAQTFSVIGMVSTLIQDNRISELDEVLKQHFGEYYVDRQIKGPELNYQQMVNLLGQVIGAINAPKNVNSEDPHTTFLRITLDAFHNIILDESPIEVAIGFSKQFPNYYADAVMHERKAASGINPYAGSDNPSATDTGDIPFI